MTLAVEEVFSSVRGPVGNKVDLIPKAILGTESKWYFCLGHTDRHVNISRKSIGRTCQLQPKEILGLDVLLISLSLKKQVSGGR